MQIVEQKVDMLNWKLNFTVIVIPVMIAVLGITVALH